MVRADGVFVLDRRLLEHLDRVMPPPRDFLHGFGNHFEFHACAPEVYLSAGVGLPATEGGWAADGGGGGDAHLVRGKHGPAHGACSSVAQ